MPRKAPHSRKLIQNLNFHENQTERSTEPIQSGAWLQAGSGFKIKYTDTNGNGWIDAGDVWITESTASGDILHLIYIPTGGYIAQYTFQ